MPGRGDESNPERTHPKMQRVRIRKMGLDVCVTVKVQLVHAARPSGEIEEALERLEMARAAEHRGRRHEGPIAREVAEALVADARAEEK